MTVMEYFESRMRECGYYDFRWVYNGGLICVAKSKEGITHHMGMAEMLDIIAMIELTTQ